MLSSFHTNLMLYDPLSMSFVKTVTTILMSVQMRLLRSLQDLLKKKMKLFLVFLTSSLQQTRSRYHQNQTSLVQILHSTEILHLFVISESVVIVEAVGSFVVLDANFAVTIQLTRIVLSLSLSISFHLVVSSCDFLRTMQT